MTAEDKAQIELETAIGAAIREFEKKVARTVVGVAVTRCDDEYLQISAVVIERSRSRKRRMTLKMGSVEVQRRPGP